MALCCYRYLSRWEVRPSAHPVAGHQFTACFEDARTAAAAEQKVIDHSPQYAGIPFRTTCIIPAKHQRKSP